MNKIMPFLCYGIVGVNVLGFVIGLVAKRLAGV